MVVALRELEQGVQPILATRDRVSQHSPLLRCVQIPVHHDQRLDQVLGHVVLRILHDVTLRITYDTHTHFNEGCGLVQTLLEVVPNRRIVDSRDLEGVDSGHDTTH